MRKAIATALLAFLVAGLSHAQAVTTEAVPSDEPHTQAPEDESGPDAPEPEYTVVNLSTTARLPLHRMAFRMTHRFSRGVEQGDFGDLASDLFGLDGGAQIGIELRYGLLPGTQLGIQRISDRTIAFFLQHDLVRQTRAPVGLAALLSIEGLDNFSQEYSPRAGVVVSRTVGAHTAFYLSPMWVGGTRTAGAVGDSDSTAVLGLGVRLGLGESAALLAEYTPRIAGFRLDGSRDHLTFGFEKRVGGHAFQLNVSNDLGTTPAQVARGHVGRRDWFMGFNLSRKFF